MGWAIGYDENWKRDVGFGVPSTCDHPSCNERIDRGLAYVCGGEPYGGDHGCGLHFCGKHLWYRYPRGYGRSVQNCLRCKSYKAPYQAKPDRAEWVEWKLTHDSWQQWRDENQSLLAGMRALVSQAQTG